MASGQDSSVQLSGCSVRRRGENPDSPSVEEKARLSTISQQPPSLGTISNGISSVKSDLITCMPDEVISIIFKHLRASDTTGALDKPRHAFSLAQTNSRFLKIFRTFLTRVTPMISIDLTPALNTPHILSVVRLASPVLRELHIPHSSSDILPQLQGLCPRLESLTMGYPRMRGDKAQTIVFPEALVRQLRSLCIVHPTPGTLNSLSFTPPEFLLKEVFARCIPQIMRILETPPKKLFLDIYKFSSAVLIPLSKFLLDCCPKMEDVTLIVGCIERSDNVLWDSALYFLESPLRNEKSKCRKMVLHHPFINLVKQAHPDAVLEITMCQQTFVKDGNTVYAKRLPLWDVYLTHDVSRLEEVYVPDKFTMQWNEVLADLRLSLAFVEFPAKAGTFCLNVDVLQTPMRLYNDSTMHLRPDWGAFTGARELHARVDWFRLESEGDVITLFEELVRLLNDFPGKVVCLNPAPKLYLRTNNQPLKRAAIDAVRALDVFEAKGGKAGDIRTWIIDGIEWHVHNSHGDLIIQALLGNSV